MGDAKNSAQKTPTETTEPKSGWKQSLQVPAVVVALLGTIGMLFQEPIAEFARYATSPTTVPVKADDSGGRFIEFVKANESCTRVPGRIVETPTGVNVAALICDSGDIYLAFYYFEDGVKKTKYGGIFLAETIKSGAKGIVVAGNTTADPVIDGATLASAFGLFGAAHASILLPENEPRKTPKTRKSEKPLDRIFAQQYLPIVQCQSFPDNNTVVRLIAQGDQCFIEVIDAQSGLVIDDYSVSCDEPCP